MMIERLNTHGKQWKSPQRTNITVTIATFAVFIAWCLGSGQFQHELAGCDIISTFQSSEILFIALRRILDN